MSKPIPTKPSARLAAIQAGEPRYKASPCKVCGGGERYTSCGNCVYCNRRRAMIDHLVKRGLPIDKDILDPIAYTRAAIKGDRLLAKAKLANAEKLRARLERSIAKAEKAAVVQQQPNDR